jgi:preprotein translocase subunit SecB
VARVDPKRQPGLKLQQVFLEHSNIGHKQNPLLIPPDSGKAQPIEMKVELSASELVGRAGEQHAAATVRVYTAEESTHPYTIDVAMTAIVSAEVGNENFPPMDYVQTAGATLLYPFVRELVANLTSRGRFGTIWLNPFNIQLALTKPGAAVTPTSESPSRARLRSPRKKSQSE